MIKLSIVIPVYNDIHNHLIFLLSSINNQVDIDFSELDIHLVNDGGMPVKLEKFKAFENLNLHLHEMPVNLGQGPARQYGIDHSESDYLMFMDQDDSLYSVLSLKHLLQGEGHQIISGRFLFKERAEEDTTYQSSDNKNFFLTHGKLFSRQFLTEMSLGFHPKLRYFEDHYFVGLAKVMADKIYYIEETVYLWRWNESSSSRKEGGGAEMLACLPQEGLYYLEFVREKKAEKLTAEFDNFLANCFYAFSNEKAEMGKHLADFQEGLKTFLCQFPKELASQMSRDIESQGNLFSLLHSQEYKDFLSWALGY